MAFMEVLETFGGFECERHGEIAPLINLDANANAPVTAAVIAAVTGALSGATNPSSAHHGGSQARRILAKARDAIASLAEGVHEDGVIFTSGCTEANNMVLNAAREPRATLITTEVEHASILTPARALADAGVTVHFVPVDRDGLLEIGCLRTLLSGTTGPILLSVQTANSETGVIQPMDAIAELVQVRREVIFHTDAAQSYGKLPLRFDTEFGPTVATISGHKLHAPMGVGALLLGSDEVRIKPFILGGEQQSGMRAGTEALPLIAGMATACDERRLRHEQDVAAMASARDRLEHRILAAIPGTVVNGAGARRLPNTSSIQFPGVDGMAMVARLDAEGILVSQGSACSSMRPTPSHVLLAMGLTEEEAFTTIRFSTSPLNDSDEIDKAVDIIIASYRQLGGVA